MKIGIKIFPEDLAYAKKIAKYCDFFEVMAIPESNFHRLKSLKHPFSIHTIHSSWGFNPANPKKQPINSLAVETAAKAADILKADTIVVHPGSIENRQCRKKHAISFLKDLDNRFIVENLPKEGCDGKRIGCNFWQMKQILKKTNKSMCLDFAHAAEYAHQVGIYYIDFIKRLMKLKPQYFHISDTRIQNKKDLHLHIKEGNLKLDYLEKLVPKDASITIETAHEFNKQHKDIMLLRQNR
ncbi:TIM barrel protein [Nanoarchaeota archaeon]